ncbi:MAG: family 78 glycoside hydrolase catalytic domain, partial [Terracidiphilus sp.]
PSISVTGAAGIVVKLTAGELLNSDGTVSQRSSGGPQWFSYTLRGSGVENWHPRFSYYGFRYVQVEGAGRVAVPGKARIVSLRGESVHSSSREVGDFTSSDGQLNRIHALILRAIENNTQSLFTDCPHREKLGWLEEAHLLAPSMLYDFDLAGLYAATARNIADAQKTEGDKIGMVPEIAPQYVVFEPKYDVFNDSPEWGSAAVLAPWYVYQRYGDLHFLAAQYDVMRCYVNYLATRAHDGIIDYGLGDWYDIGPGNPGLSKLTTAGVTATAIYYQDLRVTEKTAALLGMSEESRGYREQADLVRGAFNARFFDAALHRYDKDSQTAQAMPLELGMVPVAQQAAVLDALVEDIHAHHNHVTAGDIGFHYVVDALLDAGRSDVLLEMLERNDAPSYGYQLAQGATALTEAWDANPLSSQDHFMLGDAEEWFYRGLGGINIDFSMQGAKRLVLHPAVLEKIAWVHTRYESALGLVESQWRRGPEETVYDFSVPINTTATIQLETALPAAVRVNGNAASNARGEISTSIGKDSVQIVVGSGRYRIRAANPAEGHK